MSKKDNKPQEEQVADEQTPATQETEGKESAPEATTEEATAPEKDTAASDDSATEQAPPVLENTVQPQPAAQKSPATWPGKLALPLSLIALGAAGYLYWQSLQQNSIQTQQNSALQSEVSSSLNQARQSLDKTVADMNQKLGQLQAQSQADKNNIDELQDRLTRSIQQVTAKQQTNRKDWLLAEVEYLLRLANQRVLMEQTADGAIKLLRSADKILKETDDVTIYEVRKALAADIAALEAVPTLDTEGVFLTLGALNNQVPNLRMTPVSEQRKLPELLEEVTPEVVSESWSAGLKESWGKAIDKLDQLVVIQHRDEPVEPLLSPQQTYYLQQNLHLMLEQAQLALLQRKQASYDASLSKAHDWIATYFEQKDGTTQSLLRGISELQDVQVSAELPDISGSLRSLKSYLAQMAKLKEQGAS
ncbi:uroporphyrinogen-III C-methyltransferase [Neptuniibacter halophilus]|uniref:uroporphyrinogen-III C-methyltransferase n=1 Tax=Neptuniibacter halophilus TaxID=651666 RepID=UPI002572ABB6|nr:uroporphyrinogen-III C-methyltransferase [Neptuniibacter halophilus]